MSEMQNMIWDHKYAPKTVEDTILPKKQKETIKAMIAAGKIPNMLFHGTSGIGKTTLARAIAYETDADFHVVNASMDGNMDNLRTNITSFVSSVSFTDSKKIVLLDEADHLTCFAANQKIVTINDGEIDFVEIGELCGENFKTITYDFENREIVETEARAFISGENEVFEVTFEDGSVMTCTDSHPFFNGDGSEAKISDQILFSINIDETDYIKENTNESNSIHLPDNESNNK